MKRLRFIILMLTVTISSCQTQENRISDKLIGHWVIEEFQHQNKNLKFEYYVNVLSFQENSLKLPESVDSLKITANSNWELLQEENQNVLLRLFSPDSSFAGLYHMDFFKNHKKKLLGLKLQSENTTLTLYKLRQNFDLDGYDWDRE